MIDSSSSVPLPFLFPFRGDRDMLNPGNALTRYVRSVAEKLGLDGWHAFRRTVATTLLRCGESAKLVLGYFGNSGLNLLKSYALPKFENFRAPLAQVAGNFVSKSYLPGSACLNVC